ncbi:hypothetical protein ATO49_16345 [Mycolicibacterium fortuitum subsp. fortuitum DSM 46621 = ATCC 6841 = JCM 6387]|nr:hypothetical protein ATO49_16345 [Mycolicibacterium fortuitum subsp. fortuitum DSM 46621 = ATCC 6841 = JCM 6387]
MVTFVAQKNPHVGAAPVGAGAVCAPVGAYTSRRVPSGSVKKMPPEAVPSPWATTPVVRELGAKGLQRGLDRAHLLDAGRLERKVVQARGFWGEPAITLLPEGQPQRPAGAEEGVAVLALAVDGKGFESQRIPVEGHRAVQIGDIDADVSGGELRGDGSGHAVLLNG